MRAERLGDFQGELLLLSETNLDHIQTLIAKDKPEIMVVDSIQTMYKEEVAASPGSVSQVRESTATLMHMAKGLGITIFIIGHVTKEGVVAGPRVLEHMVDTVLYFEGDNTAAYRILRAVKNRFGSTNEIGVFEMKSTGLCEVTNPSEYMLQGKPEDEPGSVIAASLEGTRTMLVEVQALVCQTYYNMPRRTAAGTDYNRVNILLAVLEKRLGIQMSSCDVYVNVAGGMKINEPALDLAIITAILSSHRNRSLSSKTIVFGEVGLTGEVRAVNMAEQRVMDAKKMGYEICVLPQVNKEHMKIDGIQLIGIKSVRELNHILRE
jgi:DNA repair protein RadA/Sms